MRFSTPGLNAQAATNNLRFTMKQNILRLLAVATLSTGLIPCDLLAATAAAAESSIDLLAGPLASVKPYAWKQFSEDPQTPLADTWQLLDGVLTCRGTPKGYLYLDHDFTDFVLTLEWRWPAGKKPGNGGVLLRITGPDKIWPRSLEAQLNAGQAGDFWGLNGFALEGPSERKQTLDSPQFGRLTNLRRTADLEKPAGQWNQYQIIARGPVVTLRVNGQEVNRATGCDVLAGKICLTAEGDAIQFRNVRLEPLPPREVADIPAAARLVTYPAPEGEPLSADYQVWANGQKVDVYTARVLDPPFAGEGYDYGGPYSFANFDMAGRVELRIKSPRSLRRTIIRPASSVAHISNEDDHTLRLTLHGPRKFSIEPDGKKGPLLLFANPLEENPPSPNAPGVLYFGPGIHQPGKLMLTNNQTLYLAGGAIVKGGVLAQGENIRIAGRGILDGSDWEWRRGPTPHVISIRGTNIVVEGITIRGASHWTVVPRHSRNVTVRGIKLCGGRVQNDDGINPCNSQEVLITDCFIRSDDDCVALKGLDFSGGNDNVERITVENSVLWCDRARIFLLGHESRAAFMRQVTLRNLDIIHFTMTPFLFEPGEDMHLEDILVENVRLHGEGQRELIRLKPVVNQYMRRQVPGFVRNVRFRNVSVEGAPGEYLVQLEGADAMHNVRNVTFENVTVLGQPLAVDQQRVRIGQYVEGVQFTATKE